jgi:hypothetical protein
MTAKSKSTVRWVTCSRGHRFQKSSACPVCPTCWSGYYKKRKLGDFPEKISAPALRALLNAKIKNLAALSKRTEREVASLHGMGPKGVSMLKQAMRKRGLSFKK